MTLTGCWSWQYEMTVAQYRAFCAATGPPFPSGYSSWAGKNGWHDPTLQQHDSARGRDPRDAQHLHMFRAGRCRPSPPSAGITRFTLGNRREEGAPDPRPSAKGASHRDCRPASYADAAEGSEGASSKYGNI